MLPHVKPFTRGRFEELPEKPRRAHRYFESRGQEVCVKSPHFGELGVHYREVGSGPPLLLSHGLMTTSYSWRYVLDDLARDFRVIAPDLPGCGRSEKPLVRYSGDALARFILEISERARRSRLSGGRQLDGRISVHARGAGRCRRVLAPGQHPLARPVGRALCCAAHRAVAAAAARALVVVGAARAAALGAQERALLRRVAEVARGGARVRRSAGHARGRGRVHPLPVAHLRSGGAARRSCARWPSQRHSPVPLLLVYSRRDPLVPPAVGDALFSAGGARRRRWCGWRILRTSRTSTRPTAVLDAIRPFLRERR